MLDPFKKVIHDTTTEIIDSDVSGKTASVLKTLVNSVFEVIDDTLVWIQDLTKEVEEEEEPEEP